MTRSLFFDIHGLIKIQINTESRFDFLKDINFFLSYFEVKSIIDPDIILNIGKFSPSNSDCFIVDHKYYIKDNYFYCKDQEGRAKWEVEIFGFEKGKAIINFYGRILGIEQVLIPDYLAQNLILRPIIELKLLEKEYIIIHGLGMSKDGKGIIIAARGGLHKTRVAMELINNKRIKLIGDDRILIGKSIVYSFPLFYKTVVFRARKLEDQNITSLFQKIKLLYFLLEYKKTSFKDYFENRCILSFFGIGARKERIYDIRICPSLKNDLMIRLINNDKMEKISTGIKSFGFVPFYKYMLIYSYIYPKSNIIIFWEKYSKLLKENLPSNISLILFPKIFDDEIINFYKNIFDTSIYDT